jgi:3D (Asp-Asp-Asp) domain-containing protein
LNEKGEEISTEEIKGSYLGKYELTAYIATGNPCADGVYPSAGWTVASNDSRLWHHKIRIEGYGEYYVHDTGGMATNVIDIFVNTYDEAIQFGRQYGEVYLID